MAVRKRKGKGRGSPGKPKSAAHRKALSKSLKAFHSGKRRKKNRKPKAKLTEKSYTRHLNTAYNPKASHRARQRATRALGDRL